MKQFFKRLFKEDDGASALEYALISAFAVLVFAAAYAVFADMLFDFFSTFIDDINPF